MTQQLLQWESADPQDPSHSQFIRFHYQLIERHPTITEMASGQWCFVQALRRQVLACMAFLDEGADDSEVEHFYQQLGYIHSLTEAIETLLATILSQSYKPENHALMHRISHLILDEAKEGSDQKLKGLRARLEKLLTETSE